MGATDAMLRAVAKTTDLENQVTVGHIMKKRLTGQGPFPVSEHRLGVRTNRLRGSLRATPAAVAGSQVLSSIGTNVVYAFVHEFGFSGTVDVKPHARKHYRAMSFTGAGKRRVRRKVRQADVFVRPFKRKMNVPARAPITTGLEERMPAVGAEISEAIVKAWEAGQ
jgi:phage gpG-like protein